jgi:ATP synthase protein I
VADERDPPKSTNGDAEARFGRTLDRKVARKLKARREGSRDAWFWLGMFGLVGWSVAVPTLAGIALGLWIDRSWPSRVSWTLTLLFVGLALGMTNAWRWVQAELHRD